jgi:hypothetical protein
MTHKIVLLIIQYGGFKIAEFDTDTESVISASIFFLSRKMGVGKKSVKYKKIKTRIVV